TRIERGAFLLLLGIRRKIEHGELNFDPLLRTIGCLEKVETRIRHLDLPGTSAITGVSLPGHRGQPRQRMEHDRFAHATRAYNTCLHANPPGNPANYAKEGALMNRGEDSPRCRKRPLTINFSILSTLATLTLPSAKPSCHFTPRTAGSREGCCTCRPGTSQELS